MFKIQNGKETINIYTKSKLTDTEIALLINNYRKKVLTKERCIEHYKKEYHDKKTPIDQIVYDKNIEKWIITKISS